MADAEALLLCVRAEMDAVMAQMKVIAKYVRVQCRHKNQSQFHTRDDTMAMKQITRYRNKFVKIVSDGFSS
jgi:hypothetical protein